MKTPGTYDEWKGYRCSVSANQATCWEPIRFLHKSLGGTCFERNAKTVTGKTVYQWQIGAAEARIHLPFIIPFLRVKKDQAMCVLEFAQTAQRVGRGGFPIERAIQREAIYQKFLSVRHELMPNA